MTKLKISVVSIGEYMVVARTAKKGIGMFGWGKKFKISELEKRYRLLSESQKKLEFPVVSDHMFYMFQQAAAVMSYGYLMSQAVTQKRHGGALELVRAELMKRPCGS